MDSLENDFSVKFDRQSSSIILPNETVPWFHYNSVSSTMDVAANLAGEGVSPWTVISAENQSNGRGTKGRSWISYGGLGLWASIILPPPVQPSDMVPVTLLAAEALVQNVKQWVPTGLSVKHPNDVLLNGHKIAGILCESVIEENVVKSLILGIGVNLSQSRDQFLKDGLSEASSLKQESGRIIPLHAFLRGYLEKLKYFYEKDILAVHQKI